MERIDHKQRDWLQMQSAKIHSFWLPDVIVNFLTSERRSKQLKKKKIHRYRKQLIHE